MDKILFVALFGMLVAWLYSVCNQEDGENCINDRNNELSGFENEIDTESPVYVEEKQASPCT